MKFSGYKLITALTLLFLLFTDITANSETNSQLMAERVTNALRDIKKIDNPDTNEITNLILQENFEDFEKLSKYYENKFIKDPLYEWPLYTLYEALDGKNSLLLEKLDKWVEKRPSYISYGARGVYKKKRGYALRGAKYIDDTPPEKISEMRLLHQEAKRDLLIAIKQNDRLSPAYCSLIYIERASDNIDNIINIAVRSIPETYQVRAAYLESLQPRWGGSYEQMQAYVNGIDKDALINPRIWSLKGEVAAERGYTALLNKEYNISAVRLRNS